MRSLPPWLYLITAASLGLAGVISAVGMIVLAYQGREIPPSLSMLAASTFGSLASFLVQAGPPSSFPPEQPPAQRSVPGGPESHSVSKEKN